MLDDIRNIKSTKKELRILGLTMGLFFVILGSVALWRDKAYYPYFFIASFLLIFLGPIFPKALILLQKTGIGFIAAINFFLSRIILTILFYTVITPMGVVARLFGKDILDQKIDKGKLSYWHVRSAEVKDKKSYENQY